MKRKILISEKQLEVIINNINEASSTGAPSINTMFKRQTTNNGIGSNFRFKNLGSNTNFNKDMKYVNEENPQETNKCSETRKHILDYLKDLMASSRVVTDNPFFKKLNIGGNDLFEMLKEYGIVEIVGDEMGSNINVISNGFKSNLEKFINDFNEEYCGVVGEMTSGGIGGTNTFSALGDTSLVPGLSMVKKEERIYEAKNIKKDGSALKRKKVTLNYKKATSDNRKCKFCEHYADGKCDIIWGGVDPSYVCDAFKTKVIDEMTTADSSGQYAQPSVWAKNSKNWRLGRKPIIPGGTIIQKLHELAESKDSAPFKDKVTFDDCTKLNNNKEAQKGKCSVGAVDNVVNIKKS